MLLAGWLAARRPGKRGTKHTENCIQIYIFGGRAEPNSSGEQARQQQQQQLLLLLEPESDFHWRRAAAAGGEMAKEVGPAAPLAGV